ncbi:23S rRNA (uracil(1939)-C(5))-methyltransferase RlmD [Maridesulfovibrio hydrothermalis]|uniref:RNA methyltransferase, TrmA family n=1 Tax=Maridesulfovibrio hydrothermalis AM13 = DSM 14728 TaxID=1121451 RepID=L0R8E3_9BACT|nr:23S rRNA (uracil(1939)-C(5))-methyltransferase RlmD [Maridesulfovibrio hydrothermalis]CCO22487.1 RNA methyltransferase, TrmA family [Maridesulfovibrio hydrothermalis AM13 = DSM 14728]
MSNENTPITKGSTIEVTIESLAFGGQGIARHEGMTIFVDRAVPGQVVRCEITKLKKRFAEAKRVEVVTASETEQEPFCEYFGTCGGCVHQDMKYDAQTYWKGRQVSETLTRIGKIADDIEGMGAEALPSPLQKGYRNKMEFSFSGYADDLKVGFKMRGSEYDVLSIASCPLLPETCAGIPALVEEYCQASKIGSHRHGKGGYWRKLVVRVAHATGEIMIHLITAPAKSHHAVKPLEKLLYNNLAQLKTFAHSTRKGRADFATGERLISLGGEPTITETLTRDDGQTVDYMITPNAFFQTNSVGAQVLYNRCVEIARPRKTDVVYDLFCGSGGIGLFMAKDVKEVIGIELSKETVHSATQNARLNGIENTKYFAGNLSSDKDFPADLPKPDMIIVDPPRSGVPAPTLKKMKSLKPEKILYISCNPATLARDVAELGDGYTLERFSAVDMFPHTSHVECIALLTKSR